MLQPSALSILAFGFVITMAAVPANGATVTAKQAPTDGLVAHWKFDEAQGDVALDSTGNGNDGDVYGAEWVRGSFGTALRFRPSGCYVEVPEIAGLDGSDQLTLEAWVYWEGTGRYPNIITGGTWSPGGFLLFVRDSQCTFRMGKPGVSVVRQRKDWAETSAHVLSPISPGRWYHIAATFDRPTIKTYLDGRQVGGAQWNFPVAHKGDFLIGTWNRGVCHDGLIDEVKVLKRALSAEEIQASYTREAPRRTSVAAGQKPYTLIPRSARREQSLATLETDHATLSISPRGRCTALVDKRTGTDHVLKTVPFLSIKRSGATHRGPRCSYQDGKLTAVFSKAETTVVIGVTSKKRYLVFEVLSVSKDDVDLLTFLCLNLKACAYVSSMSGLAADDDFGVCVRALNLRTHAWVGRAEPIMSAMAYREHGIVGAKVALAACPSARLLPVLQEIVRTEGLPYSPLGGPFAIDAEGNRGSYVFARVSERNVDEWIDLARRGGITHIHMSGWGQSLGHYTPREDLFPRGLDSMKAVVDRIHAAGLKAGMHTLTGCISPHDPWVKPVPDKRLATDGTFTLTSSLTTEDTLVPTAEPPGDYPTIWAYGSRGNAIRIDDELLQYSGISNKPPYGFSKCKRGALGTKAATHAKGAKVHHMLVRYACFLPDENSTLVDEVADAIANVFNTCGIDQIYMDGAEAMRSWYGIARMRRAIFTRLKGQALVEASCWGHQSWPFHSRVGAWDHPKWGLKRFADDHCRAVTQYRKASLLEAQLGWWVILGPGRDWDLEMPDEIEYLCAKALGHDAPLSFQGISVGVRPPNARQEEYFTTMGRYERLRLANYFTPEVKERLREERQEFRLAQRPDGEWHFLPTDYASHKVTGMHDGTSSWSVKNRFPAQPVKLRIQALYSAFPYEHEGSIVLADFAKGAGFDPSGAARGVTHQFATANQPVKAGQASGCYTAQNSNESRLGAWARVVKEFRPVVNMRSLDAVGLWVHGDGKGELLNLQLTNLEEYFRTYDDHHVKVDFKGWRYFELHMRERDAAAYHDYKWPYGAHCVLHRSPLVRHAVSKLTLYLNNLPPKDSVACHLSPIRALRTRKVVLRNPTIQVAGKQLVFPVELTSGMFIEFDSMTECRLYDERGELVDYLTPEGDVPVIAADDNAVAFSCQGPDGFSARAEVTVITSGEPLRGRRAKDEVKWELLRREYEPPRTICALDGRQNGWQVLCRPGQEQARLELDIRVDATGGNQAAYADPSALTLESFDESARFAQSKQNQFAKYVYDSQHKGISCKPGVKQKLVPSGKIAKIGKRSGCYTAISTREDNAGWSCKGKRFKTPVNLSSFTAIGFWLHGDGKGESFKLQLRDTSGGWQDMVTSVKFTGWRYCQFDLGGPHLGDLSKIEYLLIYYNGIPAAETVTCYVDDVRVLRDVHPLKNPSISIGRDRIVFPVTMQAGDRLTLRGTRGCQLWRKAAAAPQPIRPTGMLPKLAPGLHTLTLGLAAGSPPDFRVTVSTVKVYE